MARRAPRVQLLLLVLHAGVAAAQGEPTPPPLPPPQDAPSAEPASPPPGFLVPKAINNPRLDAPAPAPPEEPETIGRRFGPMGHFALNQLNALWSPSPIMPGFAGSLGLRVALVPRHRGGSEFNVAAGAFFGVESVNRVTVLSPGVRVELVGAKGPVLVPYVSLSAFVQLLAPVDASPVGGRVGLAFSWNIIAATGWGSGTSSSFLGGGDVRGLWLLIPAAIVASFIVFGDVRVYLQPDPRTGGVFGGLSVGVGF